MEAITTIYRGATEDGPATIRARHGSQGITVDAGSGAPETIHRVAAEVLARKIGFTGTLYGATLPDGRGYAWVPGGLSFAMDPIPDDSGTRGWYERREIDDLPASERYAVKIEARTGDAGSTKWIGITPAQLAGIRAILSDGATS